MNPMRITIAILMVLLIQPVFPQDNPQEAADAESFTATKQLAEQGHVSAQFNLGLMYDNGEGVPQGLRGSRALVPFGG